MEEEEHLQDVVVATDLLQMNALKEKCVDRMAESLDDTNCIGECMTGKLNNTSCISKSMMHISFLLSAVSHITYEHSVNQFITY